MIEVFKTDIKQQWQASKLAAVLLQHFPLLTVNFDLDDCDHILRIEGHEFCRIKIAELLNNQGHICEVLK